MRAVCALLSIFIYTQLASADELADSSGAFLSPYATVLNSIIKINEKPDCYGANISELKKPLTIKEACEMVKRIEDESKKPSNSEIDPKISVCARLWEGDGNDKSFIDICNTKKDRFAKEYVPPKGKESQKPNIANALAPGKEKIKAELFKRFDELKSKESERCCQGSTKEACQYLFSQLDFKICQPPKDPAATDYCKDRGTEYASQVRYLDFFLAKFPTLNHIDFRKAPSAPVGEVRTSPYLFTGKDGNPFYGDFERGTAHELGHACEFIKSNLMSHSSNSTEAENARKYLLKMWDGNNYCEDSQTVRDHFRHLFTESFKNPQLSECLIQVTPNQKLQGQIPPCKGYCATASYDETFAMVREIASDMKKRPGYATFITCNTPRDRYHPPETDVFDCMLKYDSSFRDSTKASFCDAK